MFIGRTRELRSLEDVYGKEGFGMTVIYGRRRVGKSTLIREFIRNKKAVCYTATKVGAKRNLELFAAQTLGVLEPAYAGASFPYVENVFDIITSKIKNGKEKLVLVIDELPYWAGADGSLLSVLQKYIDTQWSGGNMMLILCGSALSFMEDKVLSEKSPVFGRRDSQIKLEPFSYRDSALFVPDYTPEDKAIVYGVTGGVAKYLELFDAGRSLDENIVRLFFSPDGYLYDETRNLLTQEFSDVTAVNNIIEQIASGVNSLNDIALKVREQGTAVLYSLEKLISVGLVEKRRCVTEEKNKKKTQYVLKDHMFEFWYTFIPGAVSPIEMGQGRIYYDNVVKPRIHSFMGGVFEDMCRYYTLEQGIRGKFGPIITKAGAWWGTEMLTDETGGRKTQSADIDIVGLSAVDKTAVIGECKFRNEPCGRDIYETLLRRAKLIGGNYSVTAFLFFSLGGFTKWFDGVQGNNVYTVSLDEMYS